MAQYKIIQDIEAEDKLLGPLSLRQFIYAIIVVVLGFVMFRLALVQPLLAIPFLPPAILFAILAAPFGHDQSSELWLLAKIRFMVKPRVRIWNQTGLQELVSVTAPKKVEVQHTDGLNQTQVKSRLEALAHTIDTRGWIVKGVDTNMSTAFTYADESSDRLVDPGAATAQAVPDIDVRSTDDVLDTSSNPVAQQMDQLVRTSDQSHRQQILDRMEQIRSAQQVAAQAPPPQPSQQPAPAANPPQQQPPAAATQALDEQAMLEDLKRRSRGKLQAYGNTHVLEVPSNDSKQQPPAAPPVTQQSQPDILNLAHNDDLTVETISRQAKKPDDKGDGEVVVSLH